MDTICVACGNLTPRGRACIVCGRGARRQQAVRPWTSRAWAKLSRDRIADHVRRHGWVCPGYRREPHASWDLTLDHVVSVSQGGALLDPVNTQVLCRGCNTRKRNVENPQGPGGDPIRRHRR